MVVNWWHQFNGSKSFIISSVYVPLLDFCSVFQVYGTGFMNQCVILPILRSHSHLGMLCLGFRVCVVATQQLFECKKKEVFLFLFLF